MSQQENSTEQSWISVLQGGLSAALDGWVQNEFSQPEILPPTPEVDRQDYPLTGFGLSENTLLLAGAGVLVLIAAIVVIR